MPRSPRARAVSAGVWPATRNETVGQRSAPADRSLRRRWWRARPAADPAASSRARRPPPCRPGSGGGHPEHPIGWQVVDGRGQGGEQFEAQRPVLEPVRELPPATGSASPGAAFQDCRVGENGGVVRAGPFVCARRIEVGRRWRCWPRSSPPAVPANRPTPGIARSAVAGGQVDVRPPNGRAGLHPRPDAGVVVEPGHHHLVARALGRV
jgi:hypothetical protein